MSEIPIVDMTTAVEICKLGKGGECCRYLMAASNGLECAKSEGNEGYRATLDGKSNSMTAQGDNCKGYL